VPISCVDAISPAFQHVKQQLLEPFRLNQWAKLALVGLFAGELPGGGCSPGGIQMPARTGDTRHLLPPGLPEFHPELYAGSIAALIVAGLVLLVVLLYVNSVMRFVLFDSVVTKRCEILTSWERRQRAATRFFGWRLLLLTVALMGVTILVGIPAAIGFAAGWLKEPSEHLLPLILGGIVVFFLLLLFVVLLAVVQALAKDFVVPQMALEGLTVTDSWRRLLLMLKAEKGQYAGYIGLKIVMAIGAAIIFGIAATIVILIVVIPVGGFGAVTVLIGKALGLTWNAFTITLVILAGCALVLLVLYAVALISVPAIVFFPAYSIYFFAGRYPLLYALIHPAQPPAQTPLVQPPPVPPEPPPVLPSSEPIG
jgi:hypothetical protein